MLTWHRAMAVPLLLLIAGCAGGGALLPLPAAMPMAEASVSFDRAGERGSTAQGLADPRTGRTITVDDPVRIASVSKLVVAIGVLRLVDQGRIDLDSDVSQWLGWPLRNPAYPDRPITLTMLLSHTSSMRDGLDYAIPLGATVQGTVASPKAWDRDHPPGAYFTYSNLNFPVVASVVQRVTGERFDRWMRANVLDPMKVDACFNWPTCSDVAVVRAVMLTQQGAPVHDDLRGRRPNCPVRTLAEGHCDLGRWSEIENGALFSPQGGLRVSARGLARIGRMLLNGGTLDGVRILSPQSVEALMTPVWRFDGRNGDTDQGFYCTYGLASHFIPTPVRGCNDDIGGDGRARVGHGGDAYGLRSGLWIDRARGTGVAFFVTGLPDDPPRGRSAFRAAEEAAFKRALAKTQ